PGPAFLEYVPDERRSAGTLAAPNSGAHRCGCFYNNLFQRQHRVSADDHWALDAASVKPGFQPSLARRCADGQMRAGRSEHLATEARRHCGLCVAIRTRARGNQAYHWATARLRGPTNKLAGICPHPKGPLLGRRRRVLPQQRQQHIWPASDGADKVSCNCADLATIARRCPLGWHLGFEQEARVRQWHDTASL
ncbi:hypothetical protein LPJ59_003062, partial [Coemansia sp. RSA 2399]